MGHDHELRAGAAETIESLAAIARLPASDGERRAAGLIRDRFAARGCRARVEEVPAYRAYAQPIGALCALAAAAGLLGGRGQGKGRGRGWRNPVGLTVGALVGAAAAYGIVDDITGGRMLARRVLMRRRSTTNVIAEAGEPDAARTLVVLVHHDAAPSGVVFGQYPERWLAARHPDIVESLTSNPPMWWPVIAGPALVSLGSVAGLACRNRLTSRNFLRLAGVALSAVSAAALADIARRPAVPGANDNLSGVAVALEVARAVSARPVAGLRLLFVSAGAEEALQQGVREFARGHFGALDPERTWFLTLDTVGSGRLVMLEGEGPVRMHDYGAPFKNLVADCARQAGIPLLRGLRSRNSTDGTVPHRHGFPTVTLVSVDDRKLLPNYHLYSDTPENVDYRSVTGAIRLTEAVARRLAAPARPGGLPGRGFSGRGRLVPRALGHRQPRVPGEPAVGSGAPAAQVSGAAPRLVQLRVQAAGAEPGRRAELRPAGRGHRRGGIFRCRRGIGLLIHGTDSIRPPGDR